MANTPSLLGNYPNTYTFTKSLTEKILAKDKGIHPITIVRPSIIGASWKEPFPGWVDTVSAAGALFLLGGEFRCHIYNTLFDSSFFHQPSE